MKVAALDLGTNTFLCLIVEGKGTEIIDVIYDDVETVRLGQDVDKTKMLHPDALIRAERCFAKFSKVIQKNEVNVVRATATSAARDAQNGYKLIELGKKFGIEIDIIKGDEEAMLTYMGALHGVEASDKVALVIDIGGGSTELIVGKRNQIIYAESLNIGGVRLTEKFIKTQPISEEDIKRLDEHVSEAVQKYFSTPLLQKSENKIEQIIAVAGTPTSIATLEVGSYVDSKIHGFNLTPELLSKWKNTFATTSIDYKREKLKLGGRADIIFAGTSILSEVLKKTELTNIFVSTKGVRYGLAKKLLSENFN